MVDEWNIHVHLPDWGESFSRWRTHARVQRSSPLAVTATGLDGTGYVRSTAACARGHWTLDTRHWTPGHSTLDTGHSTLDTGHSTLDTGPWTLDTGPWTLDPGYSTLDTGHWTPGHWTLDTGQVGGKPLMVRSAPPVTAQRARAVAGAQDPLVDAEEELIKKFFTA